MMAMGTASSQHAAPAFRASPSVVSAMGCLAAIATGSSLMRRSWRCRAPCRTRGLARSPLWLASRPERPATSLAAQSRPLPEQPLPPPLRATDGKAEGAPPEDVFTWDTITDRMPKILDSVVENLPPSLSKDQSLLDGIGALQQEMREGTVMRPLKDPSARVAAEAWNQHLEELPADERGWHDCPWWFCENYMYKRLLEELARCGEVGATLDPFEPLKTKSLGTAAEAFEPSVKPVLELVDAAEAAPAGDDARREALEAAVLRSLWGNQGDLSLSAGKLKGADAGCEIITDQVGSTLDLLLDAAGKKVVVVLDNHGLEVLCDLVLVDALFRAANVGVVELHVKDSPVFVSDVTEADVLPIVDWVEGQDQLLAKRLRAALDEGRLLIRSSPYYTTARAFWELPKDLSADYEEAAAVILKGDANYRRLLGDLHWPYDTDFQTFASGFWPSKGLVSLRTMKSGVALGIPLDKQEEAKAARPEDWLTCGAYGQVLCYREKA